MVIHSLWVGEVWAAEQPEKEMEYTSAQLMQGAIQRTQGRRMTSQVVSDVATTFVVLIQSSKGFWIFYWRLTSLAFALVLCFSGHSLLFRKELGEKLVAKYQFLLGKIRQTLIALCYLSHLPMQFRSLVLGAKHLIGAVRRYAGPCRISPKKVPNVCPQNTSILGNPEP